MPVSRCVLLAGGLLCVGVSKLSVIKVCIIGLSGRKVTALNKGLTLPDK